MPEKQRKIFACENRIIPYRFHKGVYEAHYRRDGFKVFACAKDFNQMRKRFTEKLLAQMNGEMPVISIEKAKPYRAALFRDYLNEWLEIKRKTCKPSTCKEYERLCNYNLIPAFGEKRLDELTRPVIQKYLFELVDEGKQYDLCIAIGPMIMMKFVCKLTKELNIPTIVSLNPIMVDGTGMCGACRVTVGGQVKFACVDGPEFDGHLVNFDEAMKRQQIYKTAEGRAMLKMQEGETHHGGCGQCGGDK